MPTFNSSFTIRASLDAVADFHEDADALKRLTPPPIIFQMHRSEPLKEGSITQFTLWIGPFPVRWVAVHTYVALPDGFTDVQGEGPLKSWVHRHTFTTQGDNLTQINDYIEYEHHAGLRGLKSKLLFNNATLSSIFLFRKFMIRRLVKAT